MARMAAMRKVLSPISETRIMVKAWRKASVEDEAGDPVEVDMARGGWEVRGGRRRECVGEGELAIKCAQRMATRL